MEIDIIEAEWPRDQNALGMIRQEVFIEEQHVPEALEWDGLDSECRHVLARDLSTDLPIGTGRLVADGQIGRMAICKDYRRNGIGSLLLEKLLELAKLDGHTQVYLHAQLYVVDFYKKAHFEVSGATFMDAGIPHVKMILKL